MWPKEPDRLTFLHRITYRQSVFGFHTRFSTNHDHSSFFNFHAHMVRFFITTLHAHIDTARFFMNTTTFHAHTASFSTTVLDHAHGHSSCWQCPTVYTGNVIWSHLLFLLLPQASADNTPSIAPQLPLKRWFCVGVYWVVLIVLPIVLHLYTVLSSVNTQLKYILRDIWSVEGILWSADIQEAKYSGVQVY